MNVPWLLKVPTVKSRVPSIVKLPVGRLLKTTPEAPLANPSTPPMKVATPWLLITRVSSICGKSWKRMPPLALVVPEPNIVVRDQTIWP